MAKLVDAQCSERCGLYALGGSSPLSPTKNKPQMEKMSSGVCGFVVITGRVGRLPFGCWPLRPPRRVRGRMGF